MIAKTLLASTGLRTPDPLIRRAAPESGSGLSP